MNHLTAARVQTARPHAVRCDTAWIASSAKGDAQSSNPAAQERSYRQGGSMCKYCYPDERICHELGRRLHRVEMSPLGTIEWIANWLQSGAGGLQCRGIGGRGCARLREFYA